MARTVEHGGHGRGGKGRGQLRLPTRFQFKMFFKEFNSQRLSPSTVQALKRHTN